MFTVTELYSDAYFNPAKTASRTKLALPAIRSTDAPRSVHQESGETRMVDGKRTPCKIRSMPTAVSKAKLTKVMKQLGIEPAAAYAEAP
jgi:hypothetical protein